MTTPDDTRYVPYIHPARTERTLADILASEQSAHDRLNRIRALHAPTDDPEAVEMDERWCIECVKGWDGEDWELIEYPCATIRIVEDTAP